MGKTIHDVSRVSGISVATVSKYLNGVRVRPSSAEKISAAITELGYTPDSAARSLRTGKTWTIGILVDNITNNFYNSIIFTLSNLFREKGYGCLVCESLMEEQRVSQSLAFLQEKRIDGLIVLANYVPAALIPQINAACKHVVVIDCLANGISGDFVLTNNLSAAYVATEQFITRNHKRIAIVTGHPSCFSAKERLNGYVHALSDYQIPVDKSLIFQDEYNMNGGYSAFSALLKLPKEARPTAVLITSYFMTIGAVMALNESRISIPQDMSIICFDSYDINKVFRPSLSCIEQPTEKICKAACTCMLERIGGYSGENRIMRLEAKLLLADSVISHISK